MPRYKVRLGDGSVIGPMGTDDLRAWYQKGSIDGDSLVQGEGSTSWRRLAEAVDVGNWRGGSSRKSAAPATPRPAPAPSPPRPVVTSAPPVRIVLRTGNAGETPWKKIAFALVAVTLIGAALVWVWQSGWFGARGAEDTERIRAAATAERRFVDEAAGLTLDLRGSWLILGKGQPVFPAPEDARASLADPVTGAVAYLLVENPPRGYLSLDAYLSRFLDVQRKVLPTLKEPARSDVQVGGIKARQLTGSWEARGVRFRDSITVWKDGWTYFTLVARGPEGRRPSAAAACDDLLRGFTLQGQLGRRLEEAVRKVAQEAPHLTPEAAELVMGQSAALILEPPDAFRRAYQMLGQALPSFTAKESQELGALQSAVYAALGGADQGRLGRYIERVRTRQPTTPEEDREMSRLMKTAVLRLPAAKRARLQAIFERAITTVIEGQQDVAAASPGAAQAAR